MPTQCMRSRVISGCALTLTHSDSLSLSVSVILIEDGNVTVGLTKGIGKRDRETPQTVLMLKLLSLPREAEAKHDRRIKRARPIEQIE